ncbi:MAG TPA: ABC transporter ATP-binding protein [Saprospiraceae bacterium]|nr:ABC transporter ATP-binding protein [Saprospiraceae bacterium]
MLPMISIQGIKKMYGDFTAVDGLSFQIHKNEIFGILGPNGAGKTTTINMLCGLLPLTEGKIVFEQTGNREARSLIGYCPQENIFYPKLTCMEQLIFTGNMYGISTSILRPRAAELLDKLGLTEKSDVLASKLSGGMKRRLNICLALIHDPGILVLDEPEAGLDPQSRLLVRDFIKDFGRERTVVLTTHNMDEADRLSDRIAIIDQGKLLLVDTPEKLKSTVGDGDTLELVFEHTDENALQALKQAMHAEGLELCREDDVAWVKHANILDKLHYISQCASTCQVKIVEFKLRKNTLEDVFIHLTGKHLRQQ